MELMAVRAIIYALIFLSSFSISGKAVTISLLFYFNAYCLANDYVLVNAFEGVIKNLVEYFTWLANKLDDNGDRRSLLDSLKNNRKTENVIKAMSPDVNRMAYYASMAAEIAVIAVAYGIYRLVLSSNVFNIVGLLHGN